MVKVAADIHAEKIQVFGLVQGVGFRPFLHRLATETDVRGFTLNSNDAVHIHVEGTRESVRLFIESIPTKAPPLARVEKIINKTIAAEGFSTFEIRHSTSESDAITRVSPDIAVCDDCLSDIENQRDRIGYPFTNCTNCGPRFSIIRDLPYDRPNTTMDAFTMCETCKNEYDSIQNRRYHAEPNACSKCGPQYSITESSADGTAKKSGGPITSASRVINQGGIVAIKGIGGFHLACDALNEAAVERLRKGKRREGKPFAVMCRDLATARLFAAITDRDEIALGSPQRPIVLIPVKKDNRKKPIAGQVGNGLHTLGIMLPYTPLHHLIFNELSTPVLVMTSGNLSEEPISIDNDEAILRLSSIADAFLLYNRKIHNRLDDSVLFVSNGKERLIRRSRGWAPDPIYLDFNAEGIAACGAEMKGSFCIGRASTAIISQHIGDLKNPETYEFYAEVFHRFSKLFRFTARQAVCDMHPDYLSTRFAHTLGVPVYEVQHHHAHIASVMAENGISGNVIGVSLDGTGYGDDGKIWGGEFLLCDLKTYERVMHFRYFPLPGGDAAVWEPWRVTIAILHRIFGSDVLGLDLPIMNYASRGELELLIAALEKNINCPQTSSTGRLFDAVAAMTGLVSSARFDAEAPMRLEAAIIDTPDSYSFDMDDEIDFDVVFYQIYGDIKKGTDAGEISAKFHNTIVNAIVRAAQRIGHETGVNIVALSGGVFQNRYLLEKSETLLDDLGFHVFSNCSIPANDGGVALGQLAVAAANT